MFFFFNPNPIPAGYLNLSILAGGVGGIWPPLYIPYYIFLTSNILSHYLRISSYNF